MAKLLPEIFQSKLSRKHSKTLRKLGVIVLILGGYIVVFGIISTSPNLDRSLDKNLYYEEQEQSRIHEDLEKKLGIICGVDSTKSNHVFCHYLGDKIDRLTFLDSSHNAFWNGICAKMHPQNVLILGDESGAASVFFATKGIPVYVTPANTSHEFLIRSTIYHNKLESQITLYSAVNPTIQEILRTMEFEPDVVLLNLKYLQACNNFLLDSILNQPFPINFHPAILQIEMDNFEDNNFRKCFKKLSTYLMTKGYRNLSNKSKFQSFWFEKKIISDIESIVI